MIYKRTGERPRENLSVGVRVDTAGGHDAVLIKVLRRSRLGVSGPLSVAERFTGYPYRRRQTSVVFLVIMTTVVACTSAWSRSAGRLSVFVTAREIKSIPSSDSAERIRFLFYARATAL